MKKIVLFIAAFTVLLTSCETDDHSQRTQIQNYKLATPITISKEKARALVTVEDAKPVEESRKVYAYENYIFITDTDGIHVIDNTNASAPENVSFIKIASNEDLSVKNNILYADNYNDLVVFDISDIRHIVKLNTIENVFPYYDYNVPQEAEVIRTTGVDEENEVIVGWTITQEQREIILNTGNGPVADAQGIPPDGDSAGMGGSLARFKIVEDYLYVVDHSSLKIFDISDQQNPIFLKSQEISAQIETIFNQGNYLYIGSSNGMLIYGISTPQAPEYISEIRHVYGCDPVVVQDNYAFVTIRGGNFCGQELSQLEVIDITDKSNPVSKQVLEMNEPYGLGIRGNLLFVSDGPFGLNIFNASNPENLSLITIKGGIEVYDIIPLSEKLILIGNNTLYQYAYRNEDIELISQLQLN